jgi:hypothetical protein
VGFFFFFFFSRTCLSTYFIKKKAVYRHNLMLAKQELTGTSTQRTNNREKIKKGQRKQKATKLAERLQN